MSSGTERRPDVFRHPDFTRFWVAETVSGFGSYVTTMALQVLVLLTLHGSAADVGLLNASRWAPYLLVGLVVGALVDRRRRRPVLVATDLGRAVLLGAIPLLWLLDRLSLPALLALMVAFGTLSLLSDAASQSFLPRLVPRASLLAANARLDQSSSVAQTSGPLVAGGLVTALGAPVAVLVDAVSYLVSGLAVAGISAPEPSPVAGERPRNLRREVGEGLRWCYRHPVIAPMILTTHGWFLFNSMATTVLVPFALRGLHLSAFELGMTLAAAGVGGLLGSLVSTRVGLRWGAGRTVIACRALYPLAWAVIALAPEPTHAHARALAVLVVGTGQLLYGLALGVENANEMGYQQAVTPDEMQGRMNTTRRSVNRAMIVVGAPLGGLLADALGYRPVLVAAIAGFALVAVALAASPVRHARHGDTPASAVA
jgi:MFS family permease